MIFKSVRNSSQSPLFRLGQLNILILATDFGTLISMSLRDSGSPPKVRLRTMILDEFTKLIISQIMNFITHGRLDNTIQGHHTSALEPLCSINIIQYYKIRLGFSNSVPT